MSGEIYNEMIGDVGRAARLSDREAREPRIASQELADDNLVVDTRASAQINLANSNVFERGVGETGALAAAEGGEFCKGAAALEFADAIEEGVGDFAV